MVYVVLKNPSKLVLGIKICGHFNGPGSAGSYHNYCHLNNSIFKWDFANKVLFFAHYFVDRLKFYVDNCIFCHLCLIFFRSYSQTHWPILLSCHLAWMVVGRYIGKPNDVYISTCFNFALPFSVSTPHNSNSKMVVFKTAFYREFS